MGGILRDFKKFVVKKLDWLFAHPKSDPIENEKQFQHQKSSQSHKLEQVKILTDEPVNKDYKLGFDQYASALVNIIMGSDPQFTIGIFGGWGTGKTSLMRMMHEKLNGDDFKEYVIPVWFNAWLYEREKYLAIIPLLNTVLEEISGRPELNKLNDKISKALSSLISATSVGLEYGGASIEFSPGEGGNDDADKQDTLYYSKFKQIETALNEVNKENNLRIVVFIDDLDRCAPDKVLEVLESIKIFLGISGFIYVLGLSQNVIETCINNKYKDLNIKGEDYVKKIIQIPFRIPQWRDEELKEYVNTITGNLEQPYKTIFSKFNEVVIKGMEKNPREVKRFINSYIATQEVFKDDKLNEEILLLLQVFQFSWPDFYSSLFDFYTASSDFKEFCHNIIQASKNQEIDEKYKDYIDQHVEVQEFLKSEKAREIFSKLPEEANLDKYRRSGTALGAKEEITSKENLVKLLRENITEFNKIREDNPEVIINLPKVDLRGVNMTGANLEGANLAGADLRNARLENSIMTNVNLRDANLEGVNLRNARLENSIMTNVNLRDANLTRAKLNSAKLENADLTGADLRYAELKYSKLIGAHSNQSNLTDAVLFYADLTSADFTSADLSNAGLLSTKLAGTIFKDAKLRGCDIKSAIFDTETDLRGADIDSITIQNLKGSTWTEVDENNWDKYTLDEIKKEFGIIN